MRFVLAFDCRSRNVMLRYLKNASVKFCFATVNLRVFLRWMRLKYLERAVLPRFERFLKKRKMAKKRHFLLPDREATSRSRSNFASRSGNCFPIEKLLPDLEVASRFTLNPELAKGPNRGAFSIFYSLCFWMRAGANMMKEIRWAFNVAAWKPTKEVCKL